MSTAPRYIPHYTLEDYQQWEGDWELIDGVPISMSPSPFGPHERVISRLSRTIGNQIDDHQCACEVYTTLDWIISNDTVIRPDLMVVCGDQPERHLERAPALVVEVLSDSTRGRDLTAKRTLCRENDVPHYLIIDPKDKTILLVTALAETMFGQEQSSESHIQLSIGGDCPIQIECRRLFD